ncbi:Cof-type HAD-IIB family hydrolase [Lactiplantibacillus sp. WILCCON 0030]|uniref:Cof-type HAD-IIB family hydrolase n=1 Tax=Lactiplantibacillus brownii TaxID=3069269 RepID=A0ABU1A6U3_9LACO|nr:Cof-type HAD-IIB family hydrolase [Lactiplantibacillus brownii]MDQ7936655.1 Cof-type HAD-IIB family hydrolase [Lactiplantibacillus brownii]
MSIKLIATDLNGTLLHGDQTYNQAWLQQTLTALKARGIRLVLSSGNQYAHLKQLFAGITADNLVMVAENGASIYVNDEQLYDGSLSATELEQFVTVDRQQAPLKSAYLIMVGEHGSYTEAGAPAALIAAAEKFYDNLQQVADFCVVKDKIKKISVATNPDHAAQKVAALNAHFAGRLLAHDSGYGVIDLVTAGVGKLPAVQWLMARWHLSADQLLAFGDGDNDKPLLQFAGQGVAMKNAAASVRQVATSVTELDNEHDGVLATIEKLVL